MKHFFLTLIVGALAVLATVIPTANATLPEQGGDYCRASTVSRDDADSKWGIDGCRLSCKDPKKSCAEQNVSIAGSSYRACSCGTNPNDEPGNACCQLVVSLDGKTLETFGDCLSCPLTGMCNIKTEGTDPEEEQTATAYCGGTQAQ